MSAGDWMRSNLTTQGYCLSDRERRELALGLRFSTGLCLSLVVVALALQSPAMVFVMSGIGLVAGFGARHPFDHVWNHGVRHLVGVCAAVTAMNLCLPSEALSWWERRMTRRDVIAT